MDAIHMNCIAQRARLQPEENGWPVIMAEIERAAHRGGQDVRI